MDPVLRETNRRNWNERARIHAASRFYDLDGFAEGTRRLWLHPREPDELGDVTGRSLLERGFVLELLREHHDGEWQGLPMMVREDDGWYRLPPAQRDLLPITFSLRARRR